MKKIMAFGRKNWLPIAGAAFIIGVGSVTGASARLMQVFKNPRTAVTK